MTSYRLILFLIISLTGLGLPPVSVERNLPIQIGSSDAYAMTQGNSLGSDGPRNWNSRTGSAFSQKSTVTEDSTEIFIKSTVGVDEDFSDTIDTADNQGRSKKDLFWMALIGFSTIFGAAIFAGLFYMLTNSSFEMEEPESDIAEELDDRAISGNNSQGLSSDRTSERGLASDTEEIPSRSTTANQHRESEPSIYEPLEQNQAQTNSSERTSAKSPIPLQQQPIERTRSQVPEHLARISDNQNQERLADTTTERWETSTPNFKGDSQKPPATRQNSPTSTERSPHIPTDHREVAPIANSPNRRAVGNETGELSSSRESHSLAIEQTTPLRKIDIIETLITDLQSVDPTKRRKSIWELGQIGDSRAVQPLVNLMMDSDSKQVNLILGALSEISTRTLKPIKRALTISLQDQNPDVRKNAIRDLSRIYDTVTQMSQLLRHAVNDSDVEVQETAQWALHQLSHINTMSGYQPRSTMHNSPEDLS